MRPSEKCLQFIRDWEGLRLKAYKPFQTEKYFTIGYGHCSPDVGKYDVITTGLAEELLIKDVTPLAVKISSLCPCIRQCQFDALVSLAYSIGIGAFQQSTCARYARQLNQGYNDVQVARQIVRWVYQEGKVVYGLQLRRCAEANMFLDRDMFKVVNGHVSEML